MVHPGSVVLNSQMDDEETASVGQHMAISSAKKDAIERSSNLFNDPKMLELMNFARSHTHEDRLRAAAELEDRVAKAQGIAADDPLPHMSEAGLRTDGCKTINSLMLRINSEKALLPRIGSSSALASSASTGDLSKACSWKKYDASREKTETSLSLEARQAQLVRMNQFQTRLQWREQMDNSLRRLLQGLELAGDDRLGEYSHQARCGQLDKIYDWYLKHGKKEARKERPAPPYVSFFQDAPVMPGSMRVARRSLIDKPDKTKKQDGLPHSSSSLPSLAVAQSDVNPPSPIGSPKSTFFF